jgi:exopolyphosphatase/guanosine-5'-triphosphate,3'-diphosphate pyrophosphatase
MGWTESTSRAETGGFSHTQAAGSRAPHPAGAAGSGNNEERDRQEPPTATALLSLPPVEPFYPGRYAALDVGSHSVLLLVADVDDEGRLTAVAEAGRNTRLSERYYQGGMLARPARERTLGAITEFVRYARRSGVDGLAAVGTSVLREAGNGPDFRHQVRQECGLPIEVISGEQEAELAYTGNLHDRTLPGTDGERVVLDIGGGSTELVRGLGGFLKCRRSYPMGAVRLTEQHLKGDPPGNAAVSAADAAIEHVLSDVEPAPAGSLILVSGGTAVNLARVAQAAGMVGPGAAHGVTLTHARVAELVDLFRSLPVQFRRRVPGLEPERADIILAGAMILHQLMARLSAPRVVVTANGVRHGCVYALARRALTRR